jgi:hypothetical protein
MYDPLASPLPRNPELDQWDYLTEDGYRVVLIQNKQMYRRWEIYDPNGNLTFTGTNEREAQYHLGMNDNEWEELLAQSS